MDEIEKNVKSNFLDVTFKKSSNNIELISYPPPPKFLNKTTISINGTEHEIFTWPGTDNITKDEIIDGTVLLKYK